MNIAHIAPPWIAIPPRNYGGTEIVIYNLVEEQVAQGHNVTLFAPGDAKTSAHQVSFFPKSLIEADVPWTAHLQAYYHMQKAVDYIKEHAQDFDIVHTHLSSSSDMYIFPLTAPLTIPHVTTLHSRFPFDHVPGWLGEGDQLYMEWAPSLSMIAISESARAEVSYPLNFIGVVHHGLPMQQFDPKGREPSNFFVWLGRFMPEKGAHLAVQAAKEAGVPIVLAGTIDRYLQESVRYFQDVIKPLIDNEQVRYIGPVNMKQKINLLSRARGFLNPIEWEEPFGMVMIEAMALGCPVISFARGAAPEIIVHRKTGFLVHNVAEMVRFIPRIGEIDREVTRQHIERNFSVRVMATKYVKLYNKVISKSKASMHSVAAKANTNANRAEPKLLVPNLIKTALPASVALVVQSQAQQQETKQVEEAKSIS